MISYELFDDLFEPVIVLDENAEILYYNSSFLYFFQMTPRTILKLGNIKTFFTELGPHFINTLNEFLHNGTCISPELSFMRNDQKSTVIIKGSKLFDRYVLMMKDVTVEKQLYDKYKIQIEELKNSHNDILQSDKLKALGEMSANIAHEINNPLAVASGNNELLGFSLDENDLNLQRDNIQNCQKNIETSLLRITKIIANMREFLYKSEETKEYVNFSEVINKSIELLNSRLKDSNISVNFKEFNHDYIIFGNQIKLEQVIINLLSNAIDALSENNTSSPNIQINLVHIPEDASIQLSIRDNGPGIKDENYDKIFQTFFTTKEIGKGTGLGLSIARRIIEAHQGKLEIVKSDTGANFLITLPSLELSNYLQTDWNQLLDNNSGQKRILFVDNEPQILNLCMSFLKDSNYTFLGAANAQEALNIINRSEIHLVVTDLNMPNSSGIDLLELLRKKNIAIPSLLLSSKEAITVYNQEKERLKIDGIILKPFSKEELFNSLKKTLK